VANEEHLAILKKGVKAWNEWRGRTRGTMADLTGADLRRWDLSDANFFNVSLFGAHLDEAKLTRAILSGADFRRVHLDMADLSSAKLAATNLERADLTGANLAGADLSGAKLGSTDLTGAKLNEAHLFGADLFEAELVGSNLRGARLDMANLDGADLFGADLTEAKLIGANLFGVNLRETNLSGTDVTDSQMRHTVMVALDLSVAKGVENVRHGGPSSIGIDTIFLSKGKIPDVFLRGAGVPNAFITYMKSLVANPIEFYSCFISYSTANQEFAERLYADLQNKNVRCWFAPHDVQGGKKLHEQIDEAIRMHEKVLLILSPDSMNSEWVKTEIAKARRREVREKKQVLFPVRLAPFEAIREWECFDADAGKDSAREIREYFIPDFSEWKDHDKYKKAFERLLGDLKGGTATIGAR
jgi:uncharacterized protein YjbI with pentapeptide repeats